MKNIMNKIKEMGLHYVVLLLFIAIAKDTFAEGYPTEMSVIERQTLSAVQPLQYGHRGGDVRFIKFRHQIRDIVGVIAMQSKIINDNGFRIVETHTNTVTVRLGETVYDTYFIIEKKKGVWS